MPSELKTTRGGSWRASNGDVLPKTRSLRNNSNSIIVRQKISIQRSITRKRGAGRERTKRRTRTNTARKRDNRAATKTTKSHGQRTNRLPIAKIRRSRRATRGTPSPLKRERTIATSNRHLRNARNAKSAGHVATVAEIRCNDSENLRRERESCEQDQKNTAQENPHPIIILDTNDAMRSARIKPRINVIAREQAPWGHKHPRATRTRLSCPC